MTESEWGLYGVLALLYAGTSCLWWIPRAAAALRSSWWGSARCVAANTLLGNENGGVLPLNPLWPVGTCYVTQHLPCSIGAQGVLGFTALSYGTAERPLARPPRFVAWSELRGVEARDDEVWVGGASFARCASRRLARHVAQELERLALAPAAQREELLERELERAFDVVAIAGEAGRVERATAGLARGQLAFFAGGALGIPLVIEFARPWVPLAGLVLFLGWIACAVGAWRAARRLTPPGWERWRVVLPCCVHPFPASRAREALSRDALALFHPWAACKALAAPAEFEALLATALRDARAPYWPECPLEDARAREAERSWRARVERQLLRLDPAAAERVELVPQRLAPDCLGYCARCHKQYTRLDVSCASCGERPLTPFAG